MKNCVLRAVVAGVFGAGVWFGMVGSGLGQTAPKRAMTFADLMAMRRVSDPQVSPSGKWVMFSVTEVSLEKNSKVNHLWVVPLGGGGVQPMSQNRDMGHPAKATTEILTGGQNDASKGTAGGERQVTSGEGETSGRFSPDGRWVSYSAKDQIWVAAWDEAAGTVGAAKQLTRVEGGADGAEWSPDSQRLMFVASVWPECSVRGSDGRGGAKATTEILTGGQNDASTGGLGVSGTRDVAAWKGAEPAGWAEEDACDKAKDEAAEKTPVKGQVWDGLLYRHWDHYTGAKRSHVLVVSADGSGVRDLTPATVVGDAETPTFSLGGPLGYAWAPDSKEIAYVTNLDAVPAASTNNDVFTLRLDEAGAKAEKVSTSPGSDDGPAYSPDGKWLAWRSQARNGFESDQFKLVLMDRASGHLEPIDIRLFFNHEKFTGWIDEFTWAPDGLAIVFASGIEGQEAVFEVDTPSVAGGHPTFGQETLSGEYGDLRLLKVEHVENRSEGVRHLTPTVTLVATRMAIDQPAEIVTTNLGGIGHVILGYPPSQEKMLKAHKDSYVYLTHLNDASLSPLELPKMEPFWFQGAEGTKVEGFLLKPPGFDPANKYPVKFLMHGGPQTAWGDAWSYRWNWELMAANGYVVVGINRRGSTGYGQKFVDEVSGDWGGRAYEDLMKGLDYAEGHYSFIDKTRECALGASYGGFMADWVLTHTNRFQCIVTHDGMYDPVAAYGSTEEMWFNEWEFRRPEDFPKGWDGFTTQGVKLAGDSGVGAKTTTEILTGGQNDASKRDVGGGRPAQPWRYAGLAADQDPFRKWAPVRFVENAKTPTLVIHSQKDMRLDVSQGMELFTALQRLGVPSKMLYFPDEGHWILKPQNSQVWNEVVGDWCDRWTKTGKYAVK